MNYVKLPSILPAPRTPCSVASKNAPDDMFQVLVKCFCPNSSKSGVNVPTTTWPIQTQTSQRRLIRQRTDECLSDLYKIILWTLLSVQAIICQLGKLPWLLACRLTLMLQLAKHLSWFSLLRAERCTGTLKLDGPTLCHKGHTSLDNNNSQSGTLLLAIGLLLKL